MGYLMEDPQLVFRRKIRSILSNYVSNKKINRIRYFFQQGKIKQYYRRLDGRNYPKDFETFLTSGLLVSHLWNTQRLGQTFVANETYIPFSWNFRKF